MGNHKTLQITRPYFDSKELEQLDACLKSGWVTQGPITKKFEDMMLERHKVKYAFAVSSCTAALHLAALALDLKPGDEVIVPAFTWITSANCAEYVGAKVVFADVEAETFNIDPKAFEAAITEKTKAVVVVHLFGLSAKMDEIMSIARKHSIKVIEDAACAIGTTYDNKPIGGIGDVGCFSFHPRKVITTGEGGMLTTNSKSLANQLASLRNHGSSAVPGPESGPAKPYHMGSFPILGYNYRISDIQAAIGVAQMRKLSELLVERRNIALRYTGLLSKISCIAVPYEPEKCGHTYQSYVIRLVNGKEKERNEIMEMLAEAGIQTRPGTHAVHRLEYYSKKYDLNPENYPVACICEDTTITLPIFPGMVIEDQDYIVDTIRRVLK